MRLPGGAAHRRAIAGLVAAGAVAALARAPFVSAGIGPDEGGYAYVARQWAHGARLYEQLWIDRPQGLMSLYRAILTISDHPWAIRVGALLLGVAVTLAVGAVGWMLRGPLTGVAAAALYAVIGAGPHIEGFTLNGELAASLPATAGVAAALVWWRGRRARWLVAAGGLCALALLMKQGGFDGLLAVGALAIAAGGPPLARRLRAAALVAAGAAIPLGAAAVHALTVGFGTYWNDVVAFRAAHDAFESRSHQFAASFPDARRDLLPLALLAIAGLVLVARRRGERALLGTWLVAALVAFNIGGLYWPHYYVQLVPPLVVLAAIAATSMPRPAVAAALCCAVALPVAVSLVDLETSAAEARERDIAYDSAFERDRAIARFVRASTTPRDSVYMLDSEPDVYYLAHRRTAYPYLWHHSPLLTPGGMARMRRMLTGPRRPRVVVLFRDPRHLDPSGAIANALHRNYFLDWIPAPGVRGLVVRPCVHRALTAAGRASRPQKHPWGHPHRRRRRPHAHHRHRHRHRHRCRNPSHF